eukprot:5445816-Pleurochrysis_carterae.AAC.1
MPRKAVKPAAEQTVAGVLEGVEASSKENAAGSAMSKGKDEMPGTTANDDETNADTVEVQAAGAKTNQQVRHNAL